MKWHIIGSVTGDGYSAHILTRSESGSPTVYGDEYAVLLGLGHGPIIGFGAVQSSTRVDSHEAARDLVDSFTRAMSRWRSVQARARALAQGFAIIG